MFGSADGSSGHGARAASASARIAGKPLPAPLPDDEVLETSKQLRAALGGVSDMFLWRHSRDGSTGDEAAGDGGPQNSNAPPRRGQRAEEITNIRQPAKYRTLLGRATTPRR